MEAATVPSCQALTFDQVLAEATAALNAGGVPSARLEAELLLAAACGTNRTTLCLRGRDAVPPHCQEDLRSKLARRLRREPLQYIVGRQEFWSLDFVVTPDVLIPRPETERLVELTVAEMQGRPSPRLCDVGTGSGCIAVALATEFAGARLWGLDVSATALAVAASNARRHGVEDRIRFLQSDLLDAVSGERFDAVVSNPPYVSSDSLAALQPELQWEPRGALVGGATGLEVIRRLLAAVPLHLEEGGVLLMEIGADQEAAVTGLARAAGWSRVRVFADYAGLPRVLVARR